MYIKNTTEKLLYLKCFRTSVSLIRDSSDSNPRFYIVTCAGESQSGLHIEKWEFSDTSWCRCSAYILQLYFADLYSRTQGLSHRMIILQVNHKKYDATLTPTGILCVYVLTSCAKKSNGEEAT